jgi:hypothetical protein
VNDCPTSRITGILAQSYGPPAIRRNQPEIHWVAWQGFGALESAPGCSLARKRGQYAVVAGDFHFRRAVNVDFDSASSALGPAAGYNRLTRNWISLQRLHQQRQHCRAQNRLFSHDRHSLSEHRRHDNKGQSSLQSARNAFAVESQRFFNKLGALTT